MRNIASVVLVASAVLAAAACSDNPANPIGPMALKDVPATSTSGTTAKIQGFIGTWRATTAEGWSARVQGSLRDLVAEGGTVRLKLEQGILGDPPNWPRYAITVTMPGLKPGVDTGRWVYSEFWGKPQIDFFPDSIPDPEFGEAPGFSVDLSENTLRLWRGGQTFLPFDFGWNDPPGSNSTVLNLVFTRE